MTARLMSFAPPVQADRALIPPISAVRMRHVPTGIVVTARESRSQFQNRASCVHKLQDEFRRRAVPPKVRHATKVPASQRRRRLKDKHMRSDLKASRRRITEDE